jgi:DUF1009 family protein
MKTPTNRSERLILSPSDRVAIVAGGGRLPINVANGLAEAGHKPFVILAGDEADGRSELSVYDHATLPLEDIGALVPLLRSRNTTHVVLAGAITRRPILHRIKPRIGLLMIVPKLVSALRRGDNGLLSTLIEHLESRGIRVVGAHQVVPDLIAVEGDLTRVSPTASDRRDIAAALEAARAIGALDIGQAAVAVGGRVIALEGIEGTDGLLERTKGLRSHGRAAAAKRGVLVKCAKPGQELRADLPTIGPSTVELAHAAGLAGIGVEAGRSLILDQAEVMARADVLGMFVTGLPEGSA